MKMLWVVARYEFKMQQRSLAFWLTALILLAFLFGEVLPEIQSDAVYATSESIEYATETGETITPSAEVQEALSAVNFSKYEAWLFADRIGLMSALFISILAAFVWGREWEIADVVNSRPVTSTQYVLGKYLGVVLTWGSILLPITAIAVGSTWRVAGQYALSFVWHDFISPVTVWMGISLLYGTAFVMMTSLLLRSGAGTLLVYVLYWVYNVTRLGMFLNPGGIYFLTYWFFRISRRNPGILEHRANDILLNRVVYLVMTAAVLTLMNLVFQRLRERGTPLHTASQLEQRASNWLQSLWPKIMFKAGNAAVRSLVRLLYYQMRLIWHVNLWITPVIALLIPIVLYLPDYERVYWSLKISENIIPLLGILICANLFSKEWEDQTTELWLAKATSRAKLLLARVAVACGFTIVVVIIPLGWQYFRYVRFGWGEMLLVVLPPTIFLGTMGILAGILTRRTAIAFLIPFAYWFFEMTNKGNYTGIFHLFSRTAFVCANLTCNSIETTFPWVVSKWLIVVISAGLLAFSVWFLEYFDRGSPVRR